MKMNKSTHKGKGVHWGKFPLSRSKEYEQTSLSPAGKTSSKKSGFFLGETKGNKDLPINRSS